MTSSSTNEPHSHTLYKDAAWLSQNTLTRFNALDYFSTSPFYDNTCNNSVLRMQNTDLSELVKLVGVEYGLYHAREPFVFIIRKYYRRARDQLEHLATYNIIAGEISQAPTLGGVLESRIMKSLCLTQQAFRDMEKLSTFSTATAYTWDYDKTRNLTTADLSEGIQIDEARKVYQSNLRPSFTDVQLRRRIDQLEKSASRIIKPTTTAATTAATANTNVSPSSPTSPINPSDNVASTSTASLYGLDSRPPDGGDSGAVSHKKRKDKDGSSKKERKEKKHKSSSSTTATTTNPS